MSDRAFIGLIGITFSGFFVYALRTGRAFLKGGFVATRQEQPFLYWLYVTLYVLVAGSSLYFAVIGPSNNRWRGP